MVLHCRSSFAAFFFFSLAISSLMESGHATHAYAQGQDHGLFPRMVGTWKATGEREQKISGKRVRIETQTLAQQQGDFLVSQSQVRETPLSGNPGREYTTAFWMCGASGEPALPRLFWLGGGELPPSIDAVESGGWAQSSGVYDGDSLVVTQTLGGGYRIVSRTDFTLAPDYILFVEETFLLDQLLSITQLDYQRLEVSP